LLSATVFQSLCQWQEKSQVLPTEAWIRSSVMEKKLQELMGDGLLWPRMSQDLPE
jgi:hypothetical protein